MNCKDSTDAVFHTYISCDGMKTIVIPLIDSTMNDCDTQDHCNCPIAQSAVSQNVQMFNFPR